MKIGDLPLLGGAAGLLGHAAEFRDHRLPFIDRAAREGGDACRLRFFGKEFLFVNEPALLQAILIDEPTAFNKSFGMRTSLYPLTGEGLFTADGALWRRQRRLMAPIFQPPELAPFGAAMAECARRIIDSWPDGGVVDLSQEMIRIAMAVAGRVLFDVDIVDATHDLAVALNTALEWTSFAMASFPLIVQQQLQAAVDDPERYPARLRGGVHWLKRSLRRPLLVPGPRSRALRQAIAVLDGQVQRMIDERRSRPRGARDLLARLLEARDADDGGAMSDQQVRDEVLTLFVAGHETTAANLAWTLYLFGRHPEAQRRVADEVAALPRERVWGRDLTALPYTLRVIKESLRLYPPVYIFTRRAIRDVTVAGLELPRGIELLLSPYALHRRADLWPEPARFDPDRFLPEREEARPRCAYLPFSTGPRVCIGHYFALLEAHVVLAEVLADVTLTLVDPESVTPAPATTMRPAALLARVSRRRAHAAP